MFQTVRGNKGFVFVEVIISIALISVVFTTLLGIGFAAMGVSASLQKAAQANELAKEELEAVRSFRDATTWASDGIGSLAAATDIYFTVTNNQWQSNAGTETTGIFTRKIVFEKVSRDPTTKLIESNYNSSNDDPNTRKAVVTVTWEGKTTQVITYLTNWQKQ